jgi:hypothetical protein
MSRSFLGLVVAGLNVITFAIPAVAADYAPHPRHRYVQIDDRGPNPYCGPRCGCPITTFVRHRELRQFYPSSFDPREKDEPYYAYGAMRTYARFERSNCAPVSALN